MKEYRGQMKSDRARRLAVMTGAVKTKGPAATRTVKRADGGYVGGDDDFKSDMRSVDAPLPKAVYSGTDPDRRASGGRVAPKKKEAKTNVNVIIAGKGDGPGPGGPPMPMPPPTGGVMPAKPPMPMPMPPPGGGMPMHKRGGRVKGK